MRSSSGSATDDCGRTSATSRLSTMPSPPSIRPSGSAGRRSSGFGRRARGSPRCRERGREGRELGVVDGARRGLHRGLRPAASRPHRSGPSVTVSLRRQRPGRFCGDRLGHVRRLDRGLGETLRASLAGGQPTRGAAGRRRRPAAPTRARCCTCGSGRAQPTPRARCDDTVERLERVGWQFLIGVRPQPHVRAAIEQTDETAWDDDAGLPPASIAQIARPRSASARLVVRPLSPWIAGASCRRPGSCFRSSQPHRAAHRSTPSIASAPSSTSPSETEGTCPPAASSPTPR